MNSLDLKAMVLQTLQFLVIIMIISFILDVGFERLSNEPFLKLISEWFKTIFTLNKMGLWIVITIAYSYFRVTKLKK
ncbi:hypothetical protein [Lacihabitans sp. CS3-21]|uniref:hypothetical protein n=1 Tax=Lacihabitans sp. CS3-21 TaxID=2487332 RepID=UPI0020CEDC16|nr:hypothetical protein [Lacihabitans sp. CS3-21]MCP9746568.1 hypothetical protein [Lacihabitans sp. CS3-21]